MNIKKVIRILKLNIIPQKKIKDQNKIYLNKNKFKIRILIKSSN